MAGSGFSFTGRPRLANSHASRYQHAPPLHLNENRTQPHKTTSWLQTLAQHNPFLRGVATRIERMWNERSMTTYAPIFLANLGVFFAWRFGHGTPAIRRILDKYFLLLPQRGRVVPASLLLSSFSHVGPLHFAFNMYALWTFLGALPDFYVEDMLAWYTSAGVFSALTSLTASVVFRRSVPSLGASGAVFFLASWVRGVV